MVDRRIVNYEDHSYDWDTIVGYMDDEKREKIHLELAPCSLEDFLKRYLELDTSFYKLIKNELYPLDKYQ